MKQIKAITDDAKQNMTLVLDDGSKVVFSMEYQSANQGWFMSLTYGDTLEINKRRVVTSPNMLRAFRDVIPFGLACVTVSKLEPVNKTDFSDELAILYLLNEDDVESVEESIIPLYG